MNSNETQRFHRTSADAFKGPEYANPIEGFADDMPPGWLALLIVSLAASVLMYCAGAWLGCF